METKGVTCKIPLELHNRISEEIRETESTMSKFIEMIITEHYEKGAVTVMEKGRTLAFQVSEELFQRVKEYLEAYEKAYHRRLTQKEFVIGLIEQALEEAEPPDGHACMRSLDANLVMPACFQLDFRQGQHALLRFSLRKPPIPQSGTLCALSLLGNHFGKVRACVFQKIIL